MKKCKAFKIACKIVYIYKINKNVIIWLTNYVKFDQNKKKPKKKKVFNLFLPRNQIGFFLCF